MPPPPAIDPDNPPPPPPENRKPALDAFEIILDDHRSVILPKRFDRDDLEYLHGMLDLYVKRRENKKG